MIWAIPALFFAMIGAALWFIKTTEGLYSAALRNLLKLIPGIGILGSFAFLLSSYSDYARAREALEKGEYQVVQGTVTNFVPMPPGGHGTESFSVGDVSFSYSSGWGSMIFNSDQNRGFIHEGAQVRITYTKGNIYRVEVQ